jgi:uncharacterized protein (DUF4415 family)
MDRKRTLAEERANNALMIELERKVAWIKDAKLRNDLIPAGWSEVEDKNPVRPRRVKLGVAFDADVVKWYRAMGQGYQARMNAVLRIFMLATITKEVRLRRDRDWIGGPIEDRHETTPKWD